MFDYREKDIWSSLGLNYKERDVWSPYSERDVWSS